MELNMDIPASWQKRRIRDVGEVVTGRTPSTKREDYYGGSYNLISPADLDNGKYVVSAHRKLTEQGFRECRALPKDSVLVGCIGNVGKLGMVSNERSATNQQINAVICNKDNDSHFIYYCLQESRTRLGLAADQTTLPILNKTNFENFEIATPPLAEQRKIAGVVGLVQRAIEQQDRLIALTTELKKWLLHRLFTHGLRGEPQRQTEIGPVPQSWNVATLGSLAKIGNGSTPKRDNESYWRGGTIPWLNSTKIHERFITGADQFVTELAVKECHLPSVKPGSLLIAITGQGKTLGNSALVSFETCINQHLAYAQFTSPQIVPEFVLWFMQTRYEHLRSISQAGGSTKGALTCGFLKTYPIPVPSPEEQKDIAQVFAALDRQVKAHENKHNTLAALFRTLLHQLLSAQIRVHDLDLPALETTL